MLWTSNATLTLTSGAHVEIGTNGELTSGSYPCNNNKRLDIVSSDGSSNISFATCTGGGNADFTFAQITQGGGTLDAVISDKSTHPLCVNSSLSFNGSYIGFVPAGTTVYYKWTVKAPGGSTSTFTTQNITVSNAVVGTYTVTLNVSFTYKGHLYENSEIQSYTVSPNAFGGTASPSSQSICGNTSPSNVTLTGFTGNIQWEKSTDNVTFTNISGATSSTLTSTQVGPLTQTTYLRAYVSTPCTSATSNIVTINITPATTITSQSTEAQSVCSGTNFTPISVTATGNNLTYQWCSNTTRSNLGGTVISGATSATFTPPSNLSGEKYYYCVVSGTCGTATSQPSGKFVVYTTAPAANVSIAIEVGSNPVCQGVSVTFRATPTSGGTAPVYQWKKNGINVGTDNQMYTDANLKNGDYITCTMTSNLSCLPSGTPSTVTSNTITMNVMPNTWKGTSSTAWSNSANWVSGCVPVSGADVIFDANPVNDLILDVDRIVGDLTNTSSKKLIIPVGLALTVNNKVNNNNVNQILIESNSASPNGSLIFMNPALNPSVLATVQMYTKAYNGSLTYSTQGVFSYRWQYFGIPVTSVDRPGETFYNSWVRRYDETIDMQYQKWIQLDNSSKLYPWLGYEITQDVPKTVFYQGALIVGDKTMTLPKSNVSWGAGYHIISNPYTAAIDVRKMTFGANTEATIYLYNTGTFAQWESSNGIFGSSEGQYFAIPQNTAGSSGIPFEIPSMQGYLVLATANAGSLTIPYNATISSAVKNTTMQRVVSKSSNSDVNSDEPLSNLAISVKGKQFEDHTWLFRQPGTSREFDNGWDGRKMMGAKGTPQVFSWEENEKYQVNTVEDIDSTFLGFQAGVDSVYTMTISRNNIDDLYPYLVLIDLREGRVIELNSYYPTSFSFSANNRETAEKRFLIRTKEKSKLYNEVNPIEIYSYRDEIRIRNFKESKADVSVYDMWGRLRYQNMFTNDFQIEVNTGLPRGVYVVQVKGLTESASKKLIIR